MNIVMQPAYETRQLAGAPFEAPHLRIAIGIATVGRKAILSETLKRLSAQRRAPDAIILSTPEPDALREIAKLHPHVTVIGSERGSSHQRNAIIEHLTEFDIVVFLDDDFIPCPDYLAVLEAIMRDNPDIVMTTGDVLCDGILGPGLSFQEADRILSDADDLFLKGDNAKLSPVSDGYGCNMSARLAVVRKLGVRFDERLPLYAWLEDVDFSRQLSHGGRIVKAQATRGVHLGVKLGRQRGLKLGYSQIANPIYLARKGTCPWKRSLYLMSRNVMANMVRSLRPEPWVDRRGRLLGNLLAFVDIVLGRLDTQKVLSFK